ncbi:hypothetical protein [Lentibacillus salinarum]|uniref:Uncharacterized protein n=1 Tax=Lentibacillus salinarum TaxID=446820 RepID=A0ABW3ZPG0_9BACI
MKYREWIVLLIFVSIAIMTTNFIGFNIPFTESITGVLVLSGITLIAVFLSKIIPLKLPMILFCSLLGLLFAVPLSPVSEFVTEATGKIEFKAPLSIVGALAGISIEASFQQFIQQGWRMLLIAFVVMTSTFVGSVFIAQITLMLTNAI